MTVMVFSHSDMDGASPVVLANRYFGNNVEYRLCGYNNIDETVRKFISAGRSDNYSRIYITDISVNQETAEMIDALEGDNWRLFDHHPTALWMNDKYVWALVNEYDGSTGNKTCGTKLFLDHLQTQFPDSISDLDVLTDFVEHVRQYDTWEWKTKTNNEHAKQLNDLYYLIGAAKFIIRFSEDATLVFKEGEQTLIDNELIRIEKYIKKKLTQVTPVMIMGHPAGVVFAESYTSELGNKLAESFPEYDLIAMIDMSSRRVSYRTVKDDVNVSTIAAAFGGGGHPKASGSTFGPSTFEDVIKLFYK